MADPHVAWARELDALRAYLNGPDHPPVETLAKLPEWTRFEELERLIGETPAATPVGAAEQVRLAIRCTNEGSTLGDCERAGLDNALATLERLAGEARA